VHSFGSETVAVSPVHALRPFSANVAVSPKRPPTREVGPDQSFLPLIGLFPDSYFCCPHRGRVYPGCCGDSPHTVGVLCAALCTG
jgi:hypothetical protein